MRDFRPRPRNEWNLHCFGPLRNVEQQFYADVLEYPAGQDWQHIPKRRYQTTVQRCVTARKNAGLIQPVRWLSAYTFYNKFPQNIFSGLRDDIQWDVHLSMCLFIVYITSVYSSQYTAPKRPDSYWKTNGENTAGLADNLGYYRQISSRGLEFT